MTKLLIPTLLLSFASGCATVTQGRTQQLSISSTPPGALVTVDSVEVGVTPTVASVSRKSSHTLTVALAGHAPQSQTVSPSSRADLLLLNALLLHPAGMLVGLGVDLAAGSHRRFERDQVVFLFEGNDSATLVRRTPVDASRALVPVGARVRVLRLDLPIPTTTVGAVREFTTDTLVLESASPNAFHRIPNRSIESIDLSMGPNRVKSAARWAGRGALYGLGFGVLAGAVIGFAEGAGEAGFAAVVLGGFGLIGGAAGGAVLGAATGQTDRWMNVACCPTAPSTPPAANAPAQPARLAAASHP